MFSFTTRLAPSGRHGQSRKSSILRDLRPCRVQGTQSNLDGMSDRRELRILSRAESIDLLASPAG
jgi:hypothetical protein